MRRVNYFPSLLFSGKSDRKFHQIRFEIFSFSSHSILDILEISVYSIYNLYIVTAAGICSQRLGHHPFAFSYLWREGTGVAVVFDEVKK